MMFAVNATLSHEEQILDARNKADAIWAILAERQLSLGGRGFPCVVQQLSASGDPDVARMSITWIPRRGQLDKADVRHRTYTLEITVNTFGVDHFTGLPLLYAAELGEPNGMASLEEVQQWAADAFNEFAEETRRDYDRRFPPTFRERARAAGAELLSRLKGVR